MEDRGSTQELEGDGEISEHRWNSQRFFCWRIRCGNDYTPGNWSEINEGEELAEKSKKR
jgi:hypothetical protein